jgi:hypothetical protein
LAVSAVGVVALAVGAVGVVSLFVVLIGVVVVVVVGVVSAVGDGNHSLINLLIKGLHYRGGAEASCMERMRRKDRLLLS